MYINAVTVHNGLRNKLKGLCHHPFTCKQYQVQFFISEIFFYFEIVHNSKKDYGL